MPFENPDAPERLNHLGVEVFDQDAVDEAHDRLASAGILDRVETETVCCHAAQNKVWSRELQGIRWEWYRITDDAPRTDKAAAGCCATASVAVPASLEAPRG